LRTIQQLYIEGNSLLKACPDASAESKILLLNSLAISVETFYSHPDRLVSESEAQRFFRLIAQRQKGMPLAYVIGEREFWGLLFKVSPGVLIPRPETELLVEKVIELTAGQRETVVDIGTGSGNIAVSLARELPGIRLLATDISPKALKIARLNASLHKVSGIAFLNGSLFSPLKKRGLEKQCDFLVSNPPYVSEGQWETLQDDIRLHEPKSALVSGKTGMEIIEGLVSGAPEFLKPGGHLCMEIGFGQKEQAFSLFGEGWKSVVCFEDLSGIPRVIIAQKKS
jgi:release factor glutamine methyltransferase